MKKIQIVFIILGVVLSSIIIHELVHSIQAGFKITEFCGLGWTQHERSFNSSVGWIRTNENVSEVLATSIQYIYSFIMIYFCFRRN